MNKTLSTLVLSASFAVGAGAIAQAPASAYTINGTDYLLYDVNGSSQTYVNPNANVNKLLEGNSASPGGNIELFASSETTSLAAFKASDARTSIVGTYAGKNLTLSSLTAKDWFGDSLNTSYGQNNFANKWFNAFYDAAGLASSFGNTLAKRGIAYTAFLGANLFQATSDPNISYITDNGSDLLIGLAGHYDLKAYYQTKLGPLANLIKNGFQASEVVKVQYGDVSDLLYSFSATNSGLTEKTDRSSHSGNYEVSLKGVVPPKSVPEPSLMLGLAAVGGMVAASKRKAAQK
ncbi:NF038130 family PEP-CTERM protein [Oscillatoria sp. FACHB-1406]|uniref:NF038130 family PEP-CTERM protein n=1 Tax=Oscillatoria sp. FACHB-1406 TaxID=2692846 RepID=UPI001683FF9C|nr:NF038130 family PEP-CTERM protein [Oscillatoria sp. FACHB-1406]MBD2580235.1 NF038130 family PEP-CTERM protein [Oscillatoria sp. FACHB-1406]